MDELREEFKIEQTGVLSEEEAACRATEGILSEPEERLSFKLLRASSHHWTVTGLRQKLDGGGLVRGEVTKAPTDGDFR